MICSSHSNAVFYYKRENPEKDLFIREIVLKQNVFIPELSTLSGVDINQALSLNIWNIRDNMLTEHSSLTKIGNFQNIFWMENSILMYNFLLSFFIFLIILINPRQPLVISLSHYNCWSSNLIFGNNSRNITTFLFYNFWIERWCFHLYPQGQSEGVFVFISCKYLIMGKV